MALRPTPSVVRFWLGVIQGVVAGRCHCFKLGVWTTLFLPWALLWLGLPLHGPGRRGKGAPAIVLGLTRLCLYDKRTIVVVVAVGLELCRKGDLIRVD